MKSLFAVFAVLGALTTSALADESSSDEASSDESSSDEASSDEAANACAAGQDCDKLEGEAKADCEAKKAASDDDAAEQKGGKGKAMTESQDGNMESYDDAE